ncbi:MAG: hypothetical protein R3D30_14355 [Hyphomicrobiales bacterium]
MNDGLHRGNRALYRASRSGLMSHGVITSTPSRLPGIFSFLLTGALFARLSRDLDLQLG